MYDARLVSAADLKDGRRARRAAAHRRLLLAGVEIALKEGRFRFVPAELAEAADVTSRTFFFIFGTMENYTDQLVEYHEMSLRVAMNRAVRENGKNLVKLLLQGHDKTVKQ